MSEEEYKQKVQDKINELKTNLDQGIKDLDKTMKSSTQDLSQKSKENVKNVNSLLTSKTDEFTNKMQESKLSAFNSIDQKLLELKESLTGELNSFREYVNKLVDSNENNLVTSVETALVNVSDITGANEKTIADIINKIGNIANKTTEEPIKIIKEHNNKTKDELTQSLEIDGDELVSSITKLQEEYQDAIGNQIENVFMGVKITKEEINEIIHDTLSRLEENLGRLTKGLDDNFTSEVGKTQDLLHEYEGRLLEAIKQIQENYKKQMNDILNKYSELTEKNIEDIKNALVSEKEKLLNEINSANEEFKGLISNSLEQLENQVEVSKKSIIENNGMLKDSLQNTLSANYSATDEIMKKMQKSQKEFMDQFTKQINQFSSELKKSYSTEMQNSQSEYDATINEYKNKISEKMAEFKSLMKDFNTYIKNLE